MESVLFLGAREVAAEMDFRISVLLSLQSSLWELVTPNLRGVTVREKYPSIEARFLFENDPTEEDRENVLEAETYTIADFSEDVEVTFSPAWIPMSEPRNLELDEHWVYLRKED
jgi:hypothetical protein